MSRKFAILSRTDIQGSLPAGSESSPLPVPVPAASLSPSGEYTELIRQLFNAPIAVAMIGSDVTEGDRGASQIAEKLASELASTGRRVLVVVVRHLLRMNPIIVPMEPDLEFSNTPNVWVWPGSIGPKRESSRPRDVSSSGNWLDALRRKFDAVLLDCPNADGTPGVTELASMADAALLVVEAGRTSKTQLLQDQRALQLRGALVAGCILIQRS